jgi:hypothetical protein
MRHLALLFAVIQIAGCAPDVTSHLSQISKVQGTGEQKPGPINNWLQGGIVQRSLANPTFSTRRQNALFFGVNRPRRRFNKGRGVPKWL